MLQVGGRDDRLPPRARDHLDQSAAVRVIQFAHHIVEQQQRDGAALGGDGVAFSDEE